MKKKKMEEKEKEMEQKEGGGGRRERGGERRCSIVKDSEETRRVKDISRDALALNGFD